MADRYVRKPRNLVSVEDMLDIVNRREDREAPDLVMGRWMETIYHEEPGPGSLKWVIGAVDEQGETHEVTVTRGEVAERFNVPLHTISSYVNDIPAFIMWTEDEFDWMQEESPPKRQDVYELLESVNRSGTTIITEEGGRGPFERLCESQGRVNDGA